MSLDRAVQVAKALREAVSAEVAAARDERGLLRTLDAERLFARAAQRAAFNVEVARLEGELERELRGAGHDLGVKEVSLAALRHRKPLAGGELAHVLAEVR